MQQNFEREHLERQNYGSYQERSVRNLGASFRFVPYYVINSVKSNETLSHSKQLAEIECRDMVQL